MTTQQLLISAAVLAIATGVVHSWLGERLIFRPLRASAAISPVAAAHLQRRHLGILWATWHLASVFGWALAVLLLQLAIEPGAPASGRSVLFAVAGAYGIGAVLVLFGTRGRHPGWVALAGVGILSWVASRAA